MMVYVGVEIQHNWSYAARFYQLHKLFNVKDVSWAEKLLQKLQVHKLASELAAGM